jgi:hypothetical protein
MRLRVDGKRTVGSKKKKKEHWWRGEKDRYTQREQKYAEGSKSMRNTWIYFLCSFQ